LPTLDGDEEFQVDVEKWALKDLPWLDRVGEDGEFVGVIPAEVDS
jgi:hypothetical protein